MNSEVKKVGHRNNISGIRGRTVLFFFTTLGMGSSLKRMASTISKQKVTKALFIKIPESIHLYRVIVSIQTYCYQITSRMISFMKLASLKKNLSI